MKMTVFVLYERASIIATEHYWKWAVAVLTWQLWLLNTLESKNWSNSALQIWIFSFPFTTELSVVGSRMINDSALDTDPFLLESDSYDDDPFLSQIWGDGLLGQPSDFSGGITWSLFNFWFGFTMYYNQMN